MKRVKSCKLESEGKGKKNVEREVHIEDINVQRKDDEEEKCKKIK